MWATHTMGHHLTSGVLEDSGASALPTCPLLPTPEWDIQEVCPPPAPADEKGGAGSDPQGSLQHS